MATLLPLGLQFFDAAGEPLNAGTLTFYTAATTTPKNVYSNAAQSATLSNPYTLDSEGRIRSAGIWGNGSYRVLVKSSAGTTIHDIDTLNLYNPVDWTGLTASIADINAVSGSLGTPGTVVASKALVVDASKDLATFGVLSAATLRANTAVRTPQINDSNNVAAVTIASTASQVNSVKITPAITGADPAIEAYGSDTNIDLTIDGQGTGKVLMPGGAVISSLAYPTADGTSGQFISTNGSGTLTFSSLPVTSQVVKQVVTASTTSLASVTAVIPYDDTIPQNTEGTEILTCSITPTSASSSLAIMCEIHLGGTGTDGIPGTLALFRDSTADAIDATGVYCPTQMESVGLQATVSATSTSATTFKLRLGVSSAGTINVNGTNTGRKYGGIAQSTIYIFEY